jgi:mannose-6-phosphate isomerase-like protein (cupin superfamily)
MLCKIENFRVTPSLPALGAIASALGIELSKLFDGLDGSPAIEVGRVKDRTAIKRDNSPWKYVRLLAHRMDHAVEPFIVEVPPSELRRKAYPHEGDEFMLMLSGTLEFVYGETTYRLEKGDCTYSSGQVRHTLINPTNRPASILVVYCTR